MVQQLDLEVRLDELDASHVSRLTETNSTWACAMARAPGGPGRAGPYQYRVLKHIKLASEASLVV
jgi:hypothetical protein